MSDRPIAKPTEPTGFIKARDVRFQLKNANIDPAVQHILEALAEQASHQERRMASMAQLIEQMAEIVHGFVGVAENMKKTINDMTTELASPDLGATST